MTASGSIVLTFLNLHKRCCSTIKDKFLRVWASCLLPQISSVMSGSVHKTGNCVDFFFSATQPPSSALYCEKGLVKIEQIPRD